jgi:hypothetical protein
MCCIAKGNGMTPKKVEDAFYKSFNPRTGWPVPTEWQNELYNYVILGLAPGGFHAAVFSNDMMTAASRSHPLNEWNAILSMCKWIMNTAPPQCWGSDEKVEAWLRLSKEQRTKICEEQGLLYTEEQIVWNILKD